MNLKDTPQETTPFAEALRRYRTGRRMSQLDLALACEVSARHVSFLETGRAQPSREMVLQLAEGLLLPLGARNGLLQAAGFAPAFPASELGSDALGPFRQILDEMITRHSPNPAILCDRHWTMRDANATALALLGPLQGDAGEMNLVRMLTDNPDAPRLIANYPEVLSEMSARIQLEALEAGNDPIFRTLLDALDSAMARHRPAMSSARRPVLPLILNAPGGQLSFLSTIAHFATSEDVTIRDLRLELLFPADGATRAAIAALA